MTRESVYGNKMLEKYDDVLTVGDVAELLRIGRNAAYNLVKTSEIKSIKIGRNICIPKAYVVNHLIQEFYNDNIKHVPICFWKEARCNDR